jgi:hypothetical protein
MKNKIKILIIFIFLMLGCSAFFLYLIFKENREREVGKLTKKTQQINENQPNLVNDLGEEEGKIVNIKNKKATLKSVDIGRVVVVLAEGEGEDVALDIPGQGVSLVSQTKQEDGSIMNEEIALFDLPLNQEV